MVVNGKYCRLNAYQPWAIRERVAGCTIVQSRSDNHIATSWDEPGALWDTSQTFITTRDEEQSRLCKAGLRDVVDYRTSKDCPPRGLLVLTSFLGENMYRFLKHGWSLALKVAGVILIAFMLSVTVGSAAERMPVVSTLHAMKEIAPATDPCGTEEDLVVRWYATPGMEDSPFFKAFAAFIYLPSNKSATHPFVIVWVEDETSGDKIKVYVDYNMDGVADLVRDINDEETLRGLTCSALEHVSR